MRMIGLLFASFLLLQASARDTAKTEPKEFLGVLTLTDKYKDEKNRTPQDQAIGKKHFQRLINFKNDGVVLLAGRTELPLDNSNMLGRVIFYAQDEKGAQKFMLDDPAEKNRIILVKVHPYGIAMIKCK